MVFGLHFGSPLSYKSRLTRNVLARGRGVEGPTCVSSSGCGLTASRAYHMLIGHSMSPKID